MKNILSIKQFWLILFVTHFSIVLGGLYFVNNHHFSKTTENLKEILSTKFKLINYEISNMIDNNRLKEIQNVIDLKSTTNIMFNSMSIMKNNTIIFSSNRDLLNTKIDMIKTPIIRYKEFKKIDDITESIIVKGNLHQYNNSGDYYLLINLNYTTINKFYKNIIYKNLYPILILSTIIFLIISFIFYILFVKPIQRINSKILKSKLKEDNFLLEELNYLDDTFISQFKKVKALSYTDELTQINNRKSFNKRISESISLYNRYKTPFSILMYDIDDFKKVNDTYGHSVGDKVLIEMTNLVKNLIRENDYIFRVGGEEFVIILSDTNIDESQSVAEKICKEVSELEIIENEKITISIGLIEVKNGDTEDSIFKRVDSLLYFSKLNGKNRVSTKIIGDVIYGYCFDDETNTLYERINGNFMNMNAFKDNLMNREYMKKYLNCEYIITDFRGFDMNFDHYKDEVIEMFLEYKKNFEGNEIKTKKVSTYIYKFDNENSVKPFRDLQKSYGIESQNHHTIEEISEFIGFDTQKYFNLTDNQLTIHR